MNTSRIEEAILSAVGDRWTKVAMVICKVADAMGTELPTGDEGYEQVSNRIEVLVRAGRLEAQGNTTKTGDQTQKRLARVMSEIEMFRQ